jgi:glycosyltransferase involved in cell wall biosynthesis
MEIIIINDFCHVNGGASYVAIISAQKLAERGLKVTFFGAVGPIADELRHPNIECICLEQQEILKEPNKLQAAVRGSYNQTAARALRKILAAKNPVETLIHLHLCTKALSPLVMKVALDSSFRTVATLHDYAISCPNGGFFVYPKAELCHRVPLSLDCIACNCDRRSYAQKLWRVARSTLQNKLWGIDRRLRYGIFPSRLARKLLTPYLRGLKVGVTISCPVHAPELPPTTPAREKSFLFVGRLVPEKGGHLFAEAARRAKVPARFIGDGEERSGLGKICPEAEFTGWLDQATVTERLRHCRALVFPSLWYETLGLVVVEAMAQGIPVIVSDATAAAGLINDDDTGLLFASGSVEDLQRQIERLQDDRLVEKLGQRAYQWYWNAPWTAEKHVRELESLYAEILRDDQTN